MLHSTTGRRGVLAGGTARAASGIIRPREARAAKAPDVVLESEVIILDPHVITAAITRSFATHVFDTLFAMDDRGQIRPQMVEAWETSADRLTWRFRLREELTWHDGAPVTVAECVLSLNRWAPRDPLGRMLEAATASLEASDARSFTLVLERFADYAPRAEPPDFLAGGKRVKIDQLNLRVMPDQVTGAAAPMQGEILHMQYLPFDLLPRLEHARAGCTSSRAISA